MKRAAMVLVTRRRRIKNVLRLSVVLRRKRHCPDAETRAQHLPLMSFIQEFGQDAGRFATLLFLSFRRVVH